MRQVLYDKPTKPCVLLPHIDNIPSNCANSVLLTFGLHWDHSVRIPSVLLYQRAAEPREGEGEGAEALTLPPKHQIKLNLAAGPEEGVRAPRYFC